MNNASNHAATRENSDLAVSAKTGEGLDELRAAIRDALVPKEDRANTRPWIFDPRLLNA